MLTALPEGRIEGAHLSRDTWLHWLYALGAAGLFLVVAMLLFPSGDAEMSGILGAAVFTATVGIILLLGVQLAAAWTQGVWVRGRGILTIIFYILKFIGFSYRSASDPDSNLGVSFFGFTFGVGLCEELVKALAAGVALTHRPIIRLARRLPLGPGLRRRLRRRRRDHLLFRLLQRHPRPRHLRRPLHLLRRPARHLERAVASASTATATSSRAPFEWTDYLVPLVASPLDTMILHGLYDTLLKKDMNGGALIVAIVSFAWLACSIEWARWGEAAEPPGRGYSASAG